MSDYFAELRRQSEEALMRQFERCVEQGRFANTPETRAAFFDGWVGVGKFQSAKRDHHNEGSVFLAVGSVLAVFGCMFFALPLFVMATRTDITHNVSESLFISMVGLLALAIGLWSFRCAGIRGKKSKIAFDAEWKCSDPQPK